MKRTLLVLPCLLLGGWIAAANPGQALASPPTLAAAAPAGDLSEARRLVKACLHIHPAVAVRDCAGGAEAEDVVSYLEEVERRMGLPTCDPFRQGAGRLVDALDAIG